MALVSHWNAIRALLAIFVGDDGFISVSILRLSRQMSLNVGIIDHSDFKMTPENSKTAPHRISRLC
jgi:hypothetical protein